MPFGSADWHEAPLPEHPTYLSEDDPRFQILQLMATNYHDMVDADLMAIKQDAQQKNEDIPFFGFSHASKCIHGNVAMSATTSLYIHSGEVNLAKKNNVGLRLCRNKITVCYLSGIVMCDVDLPWRHFIKEMGTTRVVTQIIYDYITRIASEEKYEKVIVANTCVLVETPNGMHAYFNQPSSYDAKTMWTVLADFLRRTCDSQYVCRWMVDQSRGFCDKVFDYGLPRDAGEDGHFVNDAFHPGNIVQAGNPDENVKLWGNVTKHVESAASPTIFQPNGMTEEIGAALSIRKNVAARLRFAFLDLYKRTAQSFQQNFNMCIRTANAYAVIAKHKPLATYFNITKTITDKFQLTNVNHVSMLLFQYTPYKQFQVDKFPAYAQNFFTKLMEPIHTDDLHVTPVLGRYAYIVPESLTSAETIKTALNDKYDAALELNNALDNVLDRVIYANVRLQTFKYVLKRKPTPMEEELLMGGIEALHRLFHGAYDGDKPMKTILMGRFEPVRDFWPERVEQCEKYLRALVGDARTMEHKSELALDILLSHFDTPRERIVCQHMCAVADLDTGFADIVRRFSSDAVQTASILLREHKVFPLRASHLLMTPLSRLFGSSDLCVILDKFIQRCRLISQFATHGDAEDEPDRVAVYTIVCLGSAELQTQVLAELAAKVQLNLDDQFISAIEQIGVDTQNVRQVVLMSKSVPLIEIVDVVRTEFKFGRLDVSMSQKNTCHLGDAAADWGWPMWSHWAVIARQSETLLQQLTIKSAQVHGNWIKGMCATFKNSNVYHIQITTPPYRPEDSYNVNNVYCRGVDTSSIGFDRYVVTSKCYRTWGNIVKRQNGHLYYESSLVTFVVPDDTPVGPAKVVDLRNSDDIDRPGSIDLQIVGDDGMEVIRTVENPIDAASPANIRDVCAQLSYLQPRLMEGLETRGDILLKAFRDHVVVDHPEFFKQGDTPLEPGAAIAVLHDLFIEDEHMAACFDAVKTHTPFLQTMDYMEVKYWLFDQDNRVNDLLDIETFNNIILQLMELAPDPNFSIQSIVAAVNPANGTSFLYIFLQFLAGYVIASLQYIRQSLNGPVAELHHQHLVHANVMKLLHSSAVAQVFSAGIDEIVKCMVGRSSMVEDLMVVSRDTFSHVTDDPNDYLQSYVDGVSSGVQDMWMFIQSPGSDKIYDEYILYFGGLRRDTFQVSEKKSTVAQTFKTNSRLEVNLAHLVLLYIFHQNVEGENDNVLLWSQLDGIRRAFLVNEANQYLSRLNDEYPLSWKSGFRDFHPDELAQGVHLLVPSGAVGTKWVPGVHDE